MNKLWEVYRQKKGPRMELVNVSLLNKLAEQLGFSLEKTEIYCLEVWKYYKTAPPDLEMILDALDRVGVKQAPPSWIAYSISLAGSHHERTAEGQEIKIAIPRIDPKVINQIKRTIPADVRQRIHKSYGLKKFSFLDQERVNPERMGHCPHGVPVGQVCGICDPKKFREMTGIE